MLWTDDVFREWQRKKNRIKKNSYRSEITS